MKDKVPQSIRIAPRGRRSANVTPEYNRSVPAPLKNAIDVGSRKTREFLQMFMTAYANWVERACNTSPRNPTAMIKN